MEAKAKLDQSGWLQKEGGEIVKSWKKRWFCIEKGELVYYKKEGVCFFCHFTMLLHFFGVAGSFSHIHPLFRIRSCILTSRNKAASVVVFH
jgi:hypothetical protein